MTVAAGHSHHVPDPGMQAERTALSWRRTALSVAVGSLGALRVGSTESAWLAIVVGVVGLLWSTGLWWSAHARGVGALARMRAATGTACEGCPEQADLDGVQGVHIAAAALGATLAGVGCLLVVVALAVS